MKLPIGNAGFVEIMESFGSDLTVVNAARVSFNKESTEFTAKDVGLVRYLATHEHTSPFFHPQIRFRIKMPIFVARQWVRHRTARLNEISGRYSVMKDEFYVPDPENIRL